MTYARKSSLPSLGNSRNSYRVTKVISDSSQGEQILAKNNSFSFLFPPLSPPKLNPTYFSSPQLLAVDISVYRSQPLGTGSFSVLCKDFLVFRANGFALLKISIRIKAALGQPTLCWEKKPHGEQSRVLDAGVVAKKRAAHCPQL